jgi:hypothetical protein
VGVLSAAVEVVAPVSSDGVPAYPTGLLSSIQPRKKMFILFCTNSVRFHNSYDMIGLVWLVWFRVGKNPYFFVKNQPSGFLCFLGFFGFFWVFLGFLGFFAQTRGFLDFFSVSWILLGASRL